MSLFITIEHQKDSSESRAIEVSAESVTLGTLPDCDIRIRHLNKPLLLEIKQTPDGWFLINPWRLESVVLNNQIVSLDAVILEKSVLTVGAYTLQFQFPQTSSSAQFHFNFSPRDDEDLWQYLLNEKDLDEVLINGLQPVYVDYKGQIQPTPWKFGSEDFLKRKIYESSQVSSGWFSWRVDKRLRIHGALPPFVQEPHLAIRKAKAHVLSIEELENNDFMTSDMKQILLDSIDKKHNILISGATSTGKTVLMRALVEKVNHEDRLIIIEEEPETSWPHPHVVLLESGRDGLDDTVRESLRLRPDRLIVSEVRGKESYTMIQALHTGHRGSMTTIHAHTPREALSRLENLASLGNASADMKILRKQIAQSICLIVQLDRDRFGKRKVVELARVHGMEGDTILLSNPLEVESKGIKQTLKRKI